MTQPETPIDVLAFATEVLRAESTAIAGLIPRLDGAFTSAVDRVLETTGRVVVSGMGKSGLIGRKISATLASTGTPSIFLHPAEAIHGDLGQVVAGDLVVALSNSGETAEILALLQPLQRVPVALIGVTGHPESTLGRHSDVVLSIGAIEEACPLGLAPSASTTAMLALGDALALTVSKARRFSSEDYAVYHPGGSLGRKLMTVGELMRSGDACPVFGETDTVATLLAGVTRARAGAAPIVDAGGRVVGIFTDGDLRRHVLDGLDLRATPLAEVMTRDPMTIGPDELASKAVGRMKPRKIGELPVVDADGRPVGLLDIKDLLAVGFSA